MTRGRHASTARWEIVARMHVPGATACDLTAARPAQSWIVPASEGRHYARTWHAARWTAWRWTRRMTRLQDPALPTVRMTWEVRRP